jgi:hypothetical protein
MEIPTEMWRVEYELGEPSIGNRAFDSQAIEDMFCLPMEPLYSEERKNYEEHTFAEPQREGTYVAAADWAKEQDNTVVSVWRTDGPTVDLVYYLRVNRHPYPQMITWFNQALRKYNAEAIHDATGLGNVVADYLDMRVRNFHMTGEKRDDMLSEYVVAVERVKVRAPRIPSMYIAHKYAQVGDLYARGQQYHLPDEVCSAALAWNLARKHAGRGGEPIIVRRTGEPDNIDRHFRNPYLINENDDQQIISKPSGQVYVKNPETASTINLMV